MKKKTLHRKTYVSQNLFSCLEILREDSSEGLQAKAPYAHSFGAIMNNFSYIH